MAIPLFCYVVDGSSCASGATKKRSKNILENPSLYEQSRRTYQRGKAMYQFYLMFEEHQKRMGPLHDGGEWFYQMRQEIREHQFSQSVYMRAALQAFEVSLDHLQVVVQEKLAKPCPLQFDFLQDVQAFYQYKLIPNLIDFSDQMAHLFTVEDEVFKRGILIFVNPTRLEAINQAEWVFFDQYFFPSSDRNKPVVIELSAKKLIQTAKYMLATRMLQANIEHTYQQHYVHYRDPKLVQKDSAWLEKITREFSYIHQYVFKKLLPGHPLYDLSRSKAINLESQWTQNSQIEVWLCADQPMQKTTQNIINQLHPLGDPVRGAELGRFHFHVKFRYCINQEQGIVQATKPPQWIQQKDFINMTIERNPQYTSNMFR